MQVAKWGNSLAVRFPASLVQALNLKEGEEIEAVIVNIDRKNRSINLSIKARDAADEAATLQKMQSETGAQSGTTNLGALLKAKLGGTAKE